MTLPPPVYDLDLLLDTSAEEPCAPKIVADIEQAIRGGGELLRHDTWGDRALAYPIDHRTSAEYHLFQLHATPALLAELNHTLHITDGVVRFRIIKLKPGTPEAPDLRASRPPVGEPVAAGERRGVASPRLASPRGQAPRRDCVHVVVTGALPPDSRG